jgi:hypothetical protein
MGVGLDQAGGRVGHAGRPGGPVLASLNYLGEMQVRPQLCNEDHSASTLELQAVTVTIEDASGLAAPPSLDVEGFALMRHETAIRDFASHSGSVNSAYSAELAHLLRGLTGADHVHCPDTHVMRRAKRRPHGDLASNALPARFVHADTTQAGIDGTIELLGRPSLPRPVRRLAMFNMWRLISSPPTDLPLAVMDARTLELDDVAPGGSYFRTFDFEIEIAFIRPNPKHRWLYFSGMGYDDLLLFKQYDSHAETLSQVPHSAFENNTLESVPEPRVSIESRALVYWFD